MSATFWKVFELAISVLENMLLLGFCMDFMQQRPKGKRGKFLWLFAMLVGMIFRRILPRVLTARYPNSQSNVSHNSHRS